MYLRSAVLASISAVLALTATAIMAQPLREGEEHAVKAAILYKLGKFVTWPDTAFENPDSPFTIGILGRDPFQGVLKEIVRRKRTAGRRMEIAYFDDVDAIGGCQVLFLQTDALEQVARLRNETRRQYVLTVADTPGFIEAGGMVLLSVVDEFVVIDVNEAEAAAAGLRISAGLLDIARRVVKRPEDDDS